MDKILIILLVLSLCDNLQTIDPEYYFHNRFKDFVNLFANTIEDLTSLTNSGGRSLPLNNSAYNAHVSFWCSKPYDTKRQKVHINEINVWNKIDIQNPIAFIIHGWTDNIHRLWAKRIVGNFAKYTSYNVCGVNWNRLALVKYGFASQNTRIVSQQLIQFINNLLSYGFSLDQITLIGHSMGAQISGQTGQYFNGQLPHIIALDPAGWHYTKPFKVNDRLTTADAKFVQCIHTDNAYFGLGTTLDECHQSYYVNGGLTPQPGCVNPLKENGLALIPFVCSHYKAVEYFEYSINPANKFKGTHCQFGYVGWKKGRCTNNKYDYLGIYSSKTVRGSLYLKTSVYPPYSL